MSKKKSWWSKFKATFKTIKHASPKKRTLVCVECGCTFEGMPRTLTCGKVCRKARADKRKPKEKANQGKLGGK